MKECHSCHISKNLKEFSVDRYNKKDGLCRRCKKCISEHSREYYRINKEKIAIIKRQYKIVHHTSTMESLNKTYRKYPEKRKARFQVNYALKIGKLTKESCKECGSINTQAHHPDYSKPLDVIWLCTKHHAMTEGRSIYGQLLNK